MHTEDLNLFRDSPLISNALRTQGLVCMWWTCRVLPPSPEVHPLRRCTRVSSIYVIRFLVSTPLTSKVAGSLMPDCVGPFDALNTEELRSTNSTTLVRGVMT